MKTTNFYNKTLASLFVEPKKKKMTPNSKMIKMQTVEDGDFPELIYIGSRTLSQVVPLKWDWTDDGSYKRYYPDTERYWSEEGFLQLRNAVTGFDQVHNGNNYINFNENFDYVGDHNLTGTGERMIREIGISINQYIREFANNNTNLSYPQGTNGHINSILDYFKLRIYPFLNQELPIPRKVHVNFFIKMMLIVAFHLLGEFKEVSRVPFRQFSDGGDLISAGMITRDRYLTHPMHGDPLIKMPMVGKPFKIDKEALRTGEPIDVYEIHRGKKIKLLSQSKSLNDVDISLAALKIDPLPVISPLLLDTPFIPVMGKEDSNNPGDLWHLIHFIKTPTSEFDPDNPDRPILSGTDFNFNSDLSYHMSNWNNISEDFQCGLIRRHVLETLIADGMTAAEIYKLSYKANVQLKDLVPISYSIVVDDLGSSLTKEITKKDISINNKNVLRLTSNDTTLTTKHNDGSDFDEYIYDLCDNLWYDVLNSFTLIDPENISFIANNTQVEDIDTQIYHEMVRNINSNSMYASLDNLTLINEITANRLLKNVSRKISEVVTPEMRTLSLDNNDGERNDMTEYFLNEIVTTDDNVSPTESLTLSDVLDKLNYIAEEVETSYPELQNALDRFESENESSELFDSRTIIAGMHSAEDEIIDDVVNVIQDDDRIVKIMTNNALFNNDILSPLGNRIKGLKLSNNSPTNISYDLSTGNVVSVKQLDITVFFDVIESIDYLTNLGSFDFNYSISYKNQSLDGSDVVLQSGILSSDIINAQYRNWGKVRLQKEFIEDELIIPDDVDNIDLIIEPVESSINYYLTDFSVDVYGSSYHYFDYEGISFPVDEAYLVRKRDEFDAALNSALSLEDDLKDYFEQKVTEAEALIVDDVVNRSLEGYDEIISNAVDNADELNANVMANVDHLSAQIAVNCKQLSEVVDDNAANLKVRADVIADKIESATLEVKSETMDILSNVQIAAEGIPDQFDSLINSRLVKNITSLDFSDLNVPILFPWQTNSSQQLFGMEKISNFNPVSLGTMLSQGLGKATDIASSTLSIAAGLAEKVVKNGLKGIRKTFSLARGNIKSIKSKSYGLSTLNIPAVTTAMSMQAFRNQFHNIYYALERLNKLQPHLVNVVDFGNQFLFMQVDQIDDLMHLAINPKISMTEEDMEDDFTFAVGLANSLIRSITNMNEVIEQSVDILETYFYYNGNLDKLLIRVPSRNLLLTKLVEDLDLTTKVKQTAENVSVAGVALIGIGVITSIFTFGAGLAIAAVGAGMTASGWAAATISYKPTDEEKIDILYEDADQRNYIRSSHIVSMWTSGIPSYAIANYLSALNVILSPNLLHDGLGYVDENLVSEGALGFVPLVSFTQAPSYKYSLLSTKAENMIQLGALTTIIAAAGTVMSVYFKFARGKRRRRKLAENQLEEKFMAEPPKYLADGTPNPDYDKQLKKMTKRKNKLNRKNKKLSNVTNDRFRVNSESGALSRLLTDSEELDHSTNAIYEIQKRIG